MSVPDLAATKKRKIKMRIKSKRKSKSRIVA